MTVQLQGLQDTAELHNGVRMPRLGLGVWKVTEEGQVEQAIKDAVNAGYRSIDTAKIYGNEEGVGRAIADVSVPRDEMFITTKVWNAEQGYDSTLAAFEESRRKLGLEIIDLYLIHWPVKGKYKETWRALEQLYKDGKVRAIGVCNFHVHHLRISSRMRRSSRWSTRWNTIRCLPRPSFANSARIKASCWKPGAR